MTIDEIIRMAKEADLWGEIYAMQRFAELVAAAEREACAKVCETHADTYSRGIPQIELQECAIAIRARGQKCN